MIFNNSNTKRRVEKMDCAVNYVVVVLFIRVHIVMVTQVQMRGR